MIAELARNYGFKRTSLSLDLLLTLLGRQDVIRFPDPERSDMTGARCLDFLLLSKSFRVVLCRISATPDRDADGTGQ